MNDVDLFAGPGGWDEGASALGLRPIGVEWDDAACATRRARGHVTIQADVSELDPAEFAPARLLIGSPPCQAFSMAGKGEGRRAIRVLLEAVASMGRGEPVDREALDAACADPRAHLVLEPLRWALALRPRFVALEQVRPVLPLWEATADVLRAAGYGTWTGVLSTERYGVPQTRERAILLAELGGLPSEPPATHQRYAAPRVKAKQEESLFDAPEPERIVAPEDRELLPWVSMAEALGWGMSARPSVTVASGGEERRGAKPLGGGSGSQATIDREREAGAWDPRDVVGFPRRADSGAAVEIDGQDYRRRDFRRASEPAFALTEKARSAVRLRANAQSNAAERSADEDEPAPTITGGHDSGDRVWVADTGSTRSGSRGDGRHRRGDEPAPALTSRADQLEVREGDPPTHTEPSPAWTAQRPATTVAGDPRVFPPGHKLNDDDVRAGRQAQHRSGAGSSNGDGEPVGQGAVRVSIEEAAVLQGFPREYPWQGSRTAIYRQIGDAVPPPFARAILAHLLPRDR